MRYFIVLSLLFSLSTQSFGRKVMSWISVYGIDNCKTLMSDPTTTGWFKNGLTNIGLQFWVPGDNGEVFFITDYQYTSKAATISQDVQDFVAWGNTNNVKIMLCLHNIRTAGFDWTLTQNVINNHPNETVASIMTIINLYGLDGVDIDFEGTGDFDSDKNAFVSFLDTLGKALHASGKELSVDMFSTPCYNAPTPAWESAMAPHVDWMNIMGYDATYETENTLFHYCPQAPSEANTYPFRYSYIENYLTVKQGVVSSKLNYGIPSWVAEWGGQCVDENILDIRDISSGGGIAIWDLSLTGASYWIDPVTWDLIAMFKNDSSSHQIRSHLLICGVYTAIAEPAKTSPIYYDSYYQIVKLAGTEGDLFLYNATGELEKSCKVKAGEEVSLHDLKNGFYIIKYTTGTEVYSQRISLLK